jgi:hypothetical protein
MGTVVRFDPSAIRELAKMGSERIAMDNASPKLPDLLKHLPPPSKTTKAADMGNHDDSERDEDEDGNETEQKTRRVFRKERRLRDALHVLAMIMQVVRDELDWSDHTSMLDLVDASIANAKRVLDSDD